MTKIQQDEFIMKVADTSVFFDCFSGVMGNLYIPEYGQTIYLHKVLSDRKILVSFVEKRKTMKKRQRKGIFKWVKNKSGMLSMIIRNPPPRKRAK